MVASAASVSSTTDEASLQRDVQRIRRVLAPFGAGGLVAMVLYVAARAEPSTVMASLGYSLAAAVASVATGSLLGFLFGIPKTLQRDWEGEAQGETAPASATASSGAPAMRPRTSVAHNTNLEQISDWLTKLLVGATLTQLGKLGELVGGVSAALAAQAPGGANVSAPYFAALVVFWTIAGFFVAYLLTRRVLPLMWENAANHRPVDAQSKDEVRTAYRARIQGNKTELTESVKALARARIEEVPLQDLTTWGRAQLVHDDYVDAVSAFERVLAFTPSDREATESLMFASLYLEPPRGFEKVISEGERIATKTSAMHLYLSAAYGQKYRWLEGYAGGQITDEMKRARIRALEEAKRALEKDRSWLGVVQGMLNGTGGDDDLVAFRDDADFKQLVAQV